MRQTGEPMAESDRLRGCAAMVLAAGQATRLRPLTAHRAKAVVPFLNRPLLDYPLDWLRRCGFPRVVVNLHHRPGSVRELYGARARGMEIVYSPEERLLGTGGGPRAALELLDETVETLLLVNGDVACALPLGPLLAAHRDTGALATLALHVGDAAAHYPPVSRDADGRVLGFGGGGLDGEGGRGDGGGLDGEGGAGGEGEAGGEARTDRSSATVGEAACFTGVHLVERKALSLLPMGESCGIVSTLYRHLLEEELPVRCVVLPGPWHEVGTPGRYIDAQLASLRREDLPLALRGHRREGVGAWVRPDADVRRAGLDGPYLLGSGVLIEDGALLQGVVAGDDTRIGPGARVRRSILLPGARVGAGARLEGAVVDAGTRVPPGARVQGLFVPGTS